MSRYYNCTKIGVKKSMDNNCCRKKGWIIYCIHSIKFNLFNTIQIKIYKIRIFICIIIRIYPNKISDFRYPADIDHIVFVSVICVMYSDSYPISTEASGCPSNMSVSGFEAFGRSDGRINIRSVFIHIFLRLTNEKKMQQFKLKDLRFPNTRIFGYFFPCRYLQPEHLAIV
jgi:hypothetical protein